MESIKKFFLDIVSIFKYIYQFSTNEEISRLRVLIVWALTSLIPSFIIYVTINTWQVHIPGVELRSQGGNSFLGLVAGTSILPILFFITNGLRGYHELFNTIIEKFFDNFERRSFTSLCQEYGNEEAVKKLRKVDLGKYVSAFVILEFIIIGWAIINYFMFGNTLSGLGLFGYVSDDLLLGALVFLLEGIYCIADSIIEAPNVYKLRPLFPSTTTSSTLEESDPWSD
jgi:hypothetical protein